MAAAARRRPFWKRLASRHRLPYPAIERLCDLKVGLTSVTEGSQHERPHKPLLPLAVFDLLDAGLSTPDRNPCARSFARGSWPEPLLHPMIQSFSDRDTEQLFRTERNKRFNAVARVALRKLIQMNHAGTLADLAVPPGNRLEALKGNLGGLHSIRINDQWRIVFRWTADGPGEVRILDYH